MKGEETSVSFSAIKLEQSHYVGFYTEQILWWQSFTDATLTLYAVLY